MSSICNFRQRSLYCYELCMFNFVVQSHSTEALVLLSYYGSMTRFLTCTIKREKTRNAHHTYRGDNIIGIEGNVLNSSSSIIVHILLDLAFLSTRSWLIDGHLCKQTKGNHHSDLVMRTSINIL